jgi:hypothetical protein
MPQAYFQYDPASPAVAHFGIPLEAPPYANKLLWEFSLAAIEHEPNAYVEAIVRGLSFYVFPRFGEGYTPEGLRTEVIGTPRQAQFDQRWVARLYSDSVGYSGPTSKVRPLMVYESYTLIQGPLLVILLVAAIAGPIFLPGRTRWAAIVFTLTALFSITFAVAGNSYDARYAYPTFGPLAAGAALGAWGVGLFLARKIRLLREPQPVASPEV